MRDFQPTLAALQSIPLVKVDRENALRRRYMLMSDLVTRPPDSLSPEEKLNLSEYLIRRGRALEAKSLLLPLSRAPGPNFLILANLATACQMLGEYQHAIDYQNELLRLWPKDFDKLDEAQRKFVDGIGWNEAPYGFYRNVETYHLKLMKLRAREALVLKGKEPQTVDALFDVRYRDDKGDFRVGYRPSGLPRDALDVVQQLLVWFPHDARLQWQLAEIYNTQATLEEIDLLRDKLGDKKLTADSREKTADRLFSLVRSLQASRTLFTEAAKSLRLEPVLEARKVLGQLELPSDFFNVDFPDPNQKLEEGLKKAEASGIVTINWRTLGIGFGTGLLVGLFGLLQIQEWRRRGRSPG